MQPRLDGDGVGPPALSERLETIAAWVAELEARLRAAELATGDEKTAKELRKAVEAVAKHDGKLHEKITNHVDVLGDRVATLAGTVAEATASLAAKDGQLATLRREIADANARVDRLASQTAAPSVEPELAQMRRTLAQAVKGREASVPDKRLARVEDKLQLLTERIDSVSGTVSTATSGIVAREGEITALKRRLDEDGARLGAAVAELRQTLDPRPLADLRSAVEGLAQETRSKLVAFGVDVEGVGARMRGVDASLASHESALGDLRGQLERGERGLAALAARSERADELLAGLAARVEEQGEALAALRREQSRDRSEVDALAERFTTGAAKVDALVHELQGALETMPKGPDPRLIRRLDQLADQLSEIVTDLDGRIDATTAEVEGVARELHEALRARPVGPDPEVVRTLEAHEATLAALTADVRRATAGAEEAQRLDGLVSELRERVARPDPSLEQTLHEQARAVASVRNDLERVSTTLMTTRAAAATESERLASALAELTARTEAMEAREAERANSLEPFAGEGRFRVELRALELRIEHAEVAARESREAVLAQLERLASRIESRLRQLEPHVEPASEARPAGEPEGQVIAIRTGEA